MRRFFIQKDQELTETQSLELSGDEFHHLRNVCRLEEGERIELLDGKGKIALGTILKIGKKTAEIKVGETRDLPSQPKPHVEIVLCIPRFQKMDLIIQKVVELGASRISPVVSDRSFVKNISNDLNGKVSRWNKIALEACKQSGRAWPLHLDSFTTLEKKIAHTSSDRALFLYEGESAKDIKTALNGWKKVPDTLTVFLGPEGGFSPQEVEKFKGHGLLPVTMGPLVLRVETACIALLSVIEYHFDAMS